MLKDRCETQKIFWCAICDIHVKNWDDWDFTIGLWGEHNRNVGQKKALAKNIAISDLKKREKSVDTLNEKEKKQLNFGKKIKTLPLTAFLLKKMKNCGGGTKTPSAAGVANGSNAKTHFVIYPPPKKNVQICEKKYLLSTRIFLFRWSSVTKSNTRPF